MLYALICHDKPDSETLRMDTRAAHLAFIETQGAAVRMGGPLLSDDGERVIGSLILLDVPDLASARAFADADPYGLAGLFDSVIIRPFRQTVGTT